MAWLNRLKGWVKGPEAPKEAPTATSTSKPAPVRKAAAAAPPPTPKAKKSPATKKRTETKKKTKVRRDPMSDSQKLLILGRERHQKGDVKHAVAHYNKAIELDPDNHEAYTNRGVARESSGDVEGAKSDYKKSIEIQVNNEINRQLDSQ